MNNEGESLSPGEAAVFLFCLGMLSAVEWFLLCIEWCLETAYWITRKYE
jgi:hypothetical protein